MPSDIAHERAEHLSYLCEKLKQSTCNPLERLMHDETGEGTSRAAKRRRDDSDLCTDRAPKRRWERDRNKRWKSLVASMMDDRWDAIPTEVIASAILYMHRYFELEPSVTENEWVLPVTSLWLACKVAGDNQFPAYGARTMERHYADCDAPGAKRAGSRGGATIRALELLMVLTQTDTESAFHDMCSGTDTRLRLHSSRNSIMM